MSYNNDGQCDYKGKYDDGTKIFFLKKRSFLLTMLNDKKIIVMR
jgi:hypothetical protein